MSALHVCPQRSGALKRLLAHWARIVKQLALAPHDLLGSYLRATLLVYTCNNTRKRCNDRQTNRSSRHMRAVKVQPHTYTHTPLQGDLSTAA